MAKTKVFFIELPIDNKPAVVCDITEKYYLNSKRVHIFIKENSAQNKVDQMLWSWKQDSFVPHARQEKADDEPVVLVNDIQLLQGANVLVMYDPVEPTYWTGYDVVVDFAEVFDTQRKEDSRARYRKALNFDKDAVAFFKVAEFLKQPQ